MKNLCNYRWSTSHLADEIHSCTLKKGHSGEQHSDGIYTTAPAHPKHPTAIREGLALIDRLEDSIRELFGYTESAYQAQFFQQIRTDYVTLMQAQQ